MKKEIFYLKKELADVARKAAGDRLTFAASSNLSARIGSRIYIKAKGVSFENARPRDFVALGLYRPSINRLKVKPSSEYRFHIACYKKRPDVKAVMHTHPLFITTLYSAGIKFKPTTLEFALYIKKSIAVVDFIPPGSKELADAVGKAITDHDAVVIKKHGLLTVGESLQEAYLRVLVIEREARAQFLCRLFKKKPPYLSKEEIASLSNI